MIKVDTRTRHRNSGRPPEKSAPGYLAWLRKLPCLLAKTGECRGKVRACHYDPWGDKGMSTKSADRSALPMCDGHHAEQTEQLGWPGFERKYDFDGRATAEVYWHEWPGRFAHERKLAS